MSLKRLWGDFTAEEFGRLDPERAIAILPIAAIEQHGPHLPVSTDATIQQGMIETVLEMADEGMDLRVLPVQAIGKSNEHLFAPGTLTLPAGLLIELWCEIGASIARAGVRKLVMVNSHGGNEEVMGIVARELRVRHEMLVVKTSWMRFGLPDGLYSEAERRYGIHGGDVETSLMLHFRPQAVDMSRARNFPSRVADAHGQFDLLAHTGTHAFAWSAIDLNPSGAVGDAAEASAQKGRATALHQASGFLQLLREVDFARTGDWIVAKPRL